MQKEIMGDIDYDVLAMNFANVPLSDGSFYDTVSRNAQLQDAVEGSHIIHVPDAPIGGSFWKGFGDFFKNLGLMGLLLAFAPIIIILAIIMAAKSVVK
jgi:hypothetical protein